MDSLQEILAAESVPESLIKQLHDGGWARDSFAHVVSKEDDLAAVWSELFPNTALTLLQKSQLRSAWSKLRENSASAASSSSQADAVSGSRVESFAPKT